MEYVLLTITLLQWGAIIYLILGSKKKPTELTIAEREKQRLERIEKDWQKLFNYNETVATKGYKDEE